MNANADQCGIVQMLRYLIQKGNITQAEGKKIAERIAAETGANIILSL